jgi:Uma2 family endonuclease
MPGMAVAERKLTADEFLALEDPRRGLQLIAGEVVVNQPGWRHQRAVGSLAVALCDWMRAGTRRGEVILPLDVKLDDHNVYAPDLLWYPAGTGPAADDRGPPYPIPDLAVEVRSPSTWRYDLGTKKSTYEAHGLCELWLVDTDGACVLVYRRSRPAAPTFDIELEAACDDSLTSPLLPGFALPLDGLLCTPPDPAG